MTERRMKFTRIDETTMADVVSELPPLEPIGDATAIAKHGLDLLVVALGFEERCSAVAEALAAAQCPVGRTIVCTYTTNSDDNEKSRSELERFLDQFGTEPVTLECDAPDFSQKLISEMAACGRDGSDGLPRVGLDVSVASTQLVMKLISAALQTELDLTLFYAEAETYFPTQKEFESNMGRWTGDGAAGALEEGILNVHPSPEYPGEHSSHLAHSIIVIPGFSRDRVRGIISAVDPEFISDVERAPVHWLISAPPATENAWRRDAQIQIHQIGETQSQADLDTFDYRETIVALEVPYLKEGTERNFTLCPLGSKMQAVGASLFCVARPEVRVMVARPERYRAGHYTEGVREKWLVSLGSSTELRARLREVGTIRLA